MILALVDSNHPGTKHFYDIAKRYDINEKVKSKESFVGIVTKRCS